MEFEKIPTVPTADEILDRSFRRAASKMRLKRNKDRANEEFVRTTSQAIHNRLVSIMQSFPELDELPPFYRDIVDNLWGIDRVKKSLGAVGWAARWARTHGPGLAYQTRRSENPSVIRKRAVARLSSVVHQIDDDLRFLNEMRNVLRKLPARPELRRVRKLIGRTRDGIMDRLLRILRSEDAKSVVQEQLIRSATTVT